MKSRKGFTLIELLAVVIILGLIIGITTVIIDKSLKDSRISLYNKQIDSIKESARICAIQGRIESPEEGESIIFTLGNLKQVGCVDKDLKDHKTDKPFDDNTTIIEISNINGDLKCKVNVE